MTLFFDKNIHKVKIIAPSSSLPNISEDKEVLQKVMNLFNTRSIKIEMSENMLSNTGVPWEANTIEFRVNDLKSALLDENVRIIWAFRGGSSAAEVAEHIDIQPTTPKVLVGFSDITTLHFLFNQKFNVPSIHGEVTNSLIRNREKELDKIIDILENSNDITYKLSKLNDIDASEVAGKIFGGNLKVITTLIGTKLHPNLKDSILIIEDVSEKGYSIMRDLVHLRQAGLLDAVKAIIFGDFIGGNEPDGKNYTELAIKTFAEKCNIPCFRISDFGHGVHNNPVILGTNAKIENNMLTISNPF